MDYPLTSQQAKLENCMALALASKSKRAVDAYIELLQPSTQLYYFSAPYGTAHASKNGVLQKSLEKKLGQYLEMGVWDVKHGEHAIGMMQKACAENAAPLDPLQVQEWEKQHDTGVNKRISPSMKKWGETLFNIISHVPIIECMFPDNAEKVTKLLRRRVDEIIPGRRTGFGRAYEQQDKRSQLAI